jgi:uncharacterized membrane protein
MKKKFKERKQKKTNLRIIITALAALVFVALAFWQWIFILPAVLLWWVNKKYIKQHFEA